MRHMLERLAYGPLRDRLNRGLMDWILDHAGRGRVRRAMEAGSGTGSGSIYLRGLIPLAVALDYDPEAIRIARRRDGDLVAVIGDLYRLPLREGSLDLVWSNSTFEELEGPEVALTEQIRALRRGGFLFIGVPNRRGPLGFEPLVRGTALGRWIGSTWTRERLRSLLQSRGLAMVAERTYLAGIFVGVLARREGF